MYIPTSEERLTYINAFHSERKERENEVHGLIGGQKDNGAMGKEAFVLAKLSQITIFLHLF
jgi:hypothetical protein